MFRVGLAIYLLITAVAQPLLCCCTVRKVVDAVSSTFSTYSDGEADTSAPTGCCCRQKSFKGSQEQSSDTASGTPAQPDHSCPCKERNSTPTLYVSVVNALGNDYQRILLQDLMYRFAVHIPLNIAAPQISTQQNDQLLLPFLTSRDLLDAFHILRC